MAEETETSQAKPSVPEELWGQKIDSLSNNGVEETTRKFCAHVRRALILYVLLLKDIGDLDTLRGVVSVLRGSTFGSYSDLCRLDRWLCCFICLCMLTETLSSLRILHLHHFPTHAGLQQAWTR